MRQDTAIWMSWSSHTYQPFTNRLRQVNKQQPVHIYRYHLSPGAVLHSYIEHTLHVPFLI